MEDLLPVGNLTRAVKKLPMDKLNSSKEAQERMIGDLEQLLMEVGYPVKLANFVLLVNDIPNSMSYAGQDIMVPDKDMLMELYESSNDIGFLE